MLASFALTLAIAGSVAAQAIKPAIWVSFGDSYSQTGFNTSGTLPNPSNPLGNPPLPGWTATGGPSYIALLATKYNKTLIYNYNFASGGATIDAKLVEPFQPTVLSLTDQVNNFIKFKEEKNLTIDETSLFSVWIGVNDIGNSFWKGGGSAFNKQLIDAHFVLMEKLWAAGARNFMFFGVPAIDRSPLMLAQPAASRAQERTAIEDFNMQLADAWIYFRYIHGAALWGWDADGAFNSILDNPKDFGFKDATSYGNGTDVFWGNDYHPGAPAYEVLAKNIATNIADSDWFIRP